MSYSSSVYVKARLEMDKRRTLSFEKQDKNRQIFYKKCPRAKEIETEIASTSVKVAKEIFSGKENVREGLERLKKNNLDLQNELENLIVSFGLPRDFLDEKYSCNLCKDTGYIDGKYCNCMRTLLRDIAYDELNKKSPLSLSDFSTFDINFYSTEKINSNTLSPREYMTKIFDYCKNYANNFSLASKNLIMTGKTGLGKTHLSLAIAKEVINKGYGVVYFSAPNLVSQLEKEHFKRNDEDENTEQAIMSCDLFILDDIGTEFSTNYTTSAIYNIINTRISNSLPTIINTNLSLDELKNLYSERFASRIFGEFQKIKFVGKDIRQIKNRKR